MNHLFHFCLIVVLMLVISASYHRTGKEPPAKESSGHHIVLMPFKGADMDMINELQKRLKKRLAADIKMAPQVQLPSSAFYEKRRRYIADSLLIFLKNYSRGRHEKVIGVTASDISTRKEPYANFGIMGLGYCPGESCVISSFRVKRTSRSREHFLRRMTVLALHELGHTYSLPHCKNDPCLMRDAEGKMNLDDGENYCADCSFYLRKWRILQ